ncbi:MAG: tRNA pseudouridine(55) synthase TruB [bacterium]
MARKRKGRPLHAILLLNKALGMSSNAALQQAKRLYHAQKAGHTGSLDPLATGMLPICFGEATKISSLLLANDKRYQTTAQLGIVTDSGDAEGNIIRERHVPVYTEREIQQVLAQFVGEIQQVPPMYSALKQDGKPLYELARAGIEVERKARQVHIYNLQLIAYENNCLVLDVQCSKGTYIRTLVEDIGEALGCGAYVKQLHRVKVAPFDDLPMYSLDELQIAQQQGKSLDDYLINMDQALLDYPVLHLSEQQLQRLRFGQRLRLDAVLFDQETPAQSLLEYRIYNHDNDFQGLAWVRPDGSLAPKKMMNLDG